MGTRPSPATRLFRIATILLPTWLAWTLAFSAASDSHLAWTVAMTLAPIWGLTACALVVRTVMAMMRRRHDPSIDAGAEIDLLTTPGSGLAWLSATFIVLALVFGYASFAVVGLLGCAMFHLAVLLALLSLRAGGALRELKVVRRFTVSQLTEGDDAIEELTITAARIPVGYRLLLTGRIGARWAETRHVLESTESGAEVVIESDVGPAVRGEHDAPALTAWLQDAFGICKSTAVAVGAMKLVVMPRVRPAEETKALLDHGIGPNASKQAARPTEGAMALREYQPGDDVRRIHWVRSLASRELVVRLPDEVPPDRPRVRLVLDTYFPEEPSLTTNTTGEMLDSLVQVWLAVARSLAESGARVTLECAMLAPEGKGVLTKMRRDYELRAPNVAQRLGAQVRWQDRMLVNDFWTGEATYVVSRAVLYAGTMPPNTRWILVLPGIGTEPTALTGSMARMPFPMGTPDNRWSVWKGEEKRLATARRDRGRALLAMRADVAPPPAGSFIARCKGPDAVRLEPIQ